MREIGVTGIPGDCKRCAIALSYNHYYPNGWGAPDVIPRRMLASDTKKQTYTGLKITFNDAQILDPYPTHKAALMAFAFNFDSCKYPELVDDKFKQKYAHLFA